MKNTLLILCIALTIPASGMQSSSGESFYSWGYSYRQGRKNVDEDQYTAVTSINNDPKRALFGVFDGHLGFQAAAYAAGELGRYFTKALNVDKLVPLESLKKAFAEIERILLNTTDAGTTASVVYLDGSTIYLAWIGDSKIAVLFPHDKAFETSEHRPNNPEENKKLMQTHPSQKNRWEKLNLVRSLGNRKTKQSIPGILLAEPEINSFPLQQNTILVLASDGYWDIFSVNQTREFIKEYLNDTIEQLQKNFPLNRGNEKSVENGDQKLALVARALAEQAYKLNSPDNIAVMVVKIENTRASLSRPPSGNASSPVGKSPVMFPIPPVQSTDPMQISPKLNHPLKLVNKSSKSLHITIKIGADSTAIFNQTIQPNHPGLIPASKNITQVPLHLLVTESNQHTKPILVTDATTGNQYQEGSLSLGKNEDVMRFTDPNLRVAQDKEKTKEMRFVFEDNPQNPQGVLLRRSTFSQYNY